MSVSTGADQDVNVASGGAIVPIATGTVQRIVAGQAVTDLASAVKELVDNAIDAGSASINIRLFNQGIDIVEVSDDGCGVPIPSRPMMAMKHATSKIQSFEDIYQDSPGVSAKKQLGFRGEALFCLANVSRNLVIATRTATDELGQKLDFRRDGTLDEGSVMDVPRKVGTTVAVVKLFDALPVRRADMVKRIKAQRAKLMRMMQAYAILCLGIRFNLIDISGPVGSTACRSEVKLSTSASSTCIGQTISSVLGSKFLSGLTRLSVELSSVLDGSKGKESERVDAFPEATNKSPPQSFGKIEGLVSKSCTVSGSGAAARDLQFFSINGRPVDLPKVSRVLGDAWRAFDSSVGGGSMGRGGKKRPACVLMFTLPSHMYDVNLSPDKREVVLTEEGVICDLLRGAVTKLWSSESDGTFSANEVESLSNFKRAKSLCTEHVSPRDNICSVASEEVTCEVKHADGAGNSSARPRRSSLMKRRNAFVHDPNSVRPSEARDLKALDSHRPTTVNTDISSESACAIASTSTPSSRKRGRDLSGKSEPTETVDVLGSAEVGKSSHGRCGGLDDQTKGSSHRERVSDSDRLKWTEIQSRFNKASREDEVSVEVIVGEVSEEDDGKENTGLCNQERSRSMEDDGTPNTRPVSSSLSSRKRLKNAAGTTTPSLETFAFSASKQPGDDPRRGVSAEGESGGESANKGNQRTKRRMNIVANGTGDPDQPRKEIRDGLQGVNGRGGESGEEGATYRKNGNQRTKRRMNIVSSGTGDPDEPRKEMHGDRLGGGNGYGEDLGSSQASSSSSASQSAQSGGCDSLAGGGNMDEDRNADSSAETHTKHPRKRSQLQALESGEHQSVSSAPIVWDSFRGTTDIVRLSRAARSRMRAERRAMHQAKVARKKRSSRDGESGSSKSGIDESVGVSDGDGDVPREQKRSQTVSLSKEDFLHMKVIGQFNLGFILARCRNEHLWILDQHACDEKYNFERLCATTVMHEQKLIAPLPLELSPSEENCVLENMETFEKNGFRFSYDREKPPRHRLALTALPHSGARDGCKAVQFGKDDVGALCAMLGADGASSASSYGAGYGTGTDGGGQYGNNAVRRYAGSVGLSAESARNGVGNDDGSTDEDRSAKSSVSGSSIVRLPKAVAMFASRACRGSIMVGKALDHRQMEAVVKKLHEVEQPWNCPHGRPTMRHVRDLLDCIARDQRMADKHIAGPSLAVLNEQDDESDDEDDEQS